LIPQDDKQHNDAIDFLADAAQEVKKMPDATGLMIDQLVLDPKQIYYETRIVDTNKLGGFVFELECLDGLREQCYFNMTSERADVCTPIIAALVKHYKYSMDAKSSETRRDKHNAQSSLIDKLVRNKQERIISLKGEAKNTFMDAIRGKQAEDSAYET